ncbi:MAG: ThuA domain-containing protein [Verrucomicrobia bacterium]|nr:ThuA domain-containing protein [Verrucomicrobiota bacterium]
MKSKSSLMILLSIAAFCLIAVVCVAQDKAKAAPKPPPPDKTKVPEISAADLEKLEAALPAKAAKPKKAHKLLVFWRCDGFFHGSGIAGGNKCLELMGKKTGAWTCDFSREWEVLSAENLAKYDGLVLNNTTSLDPSPEIKQAILDFINKGKAVIGIHAATDNFGKWVEGQQLMGGRFAGHPWGGGGPGGKSDGKWAFKLDEPNHPLCRAFEGKGFRLKDEIYQFKDAYTRVDRRVLIGMDLSDEETSKAITTPDPKTGKPRGCRDDGDYAVSWIKKVGKGRLFYCSLGHGMNVFQEPTVVQYYLDGIQWALGDTKADATPKK